MNLRRTAITLVALLALNAFLLALPMLRGSEDVTLADAPVRVGLVFDVGGRGDKSFNDSAYRGLVRAEKELGVGTQYIEPGDGADREAALRLLAAEGFDLVVAVGFIFSDDVKVVALEYPEQFFACVDFAVATDEAGNPLPLPENVVALKFREQEGSFLVGALAALLSKSKQIGFVGGMDIPLIHKFEAGYRAGAGHVCSDCEVISNYAGVTPEAFADPGKGKELAMAQYGRGVDIIYHAAGSTGLGVFEAARQYERLAIGVDSDQYDEAPGFVLTSMTKQVDISVFDTIRSVLEGRFKGGIRVFGLADNGVDYVYDERNKTLIPTVVRERVEALRRDIVAGRIMVPEK